MEYDAHLIYLDEVTCHMGKDDRPLPPSFRRRNPIFVLPLQRNGRHPVTIEPGLTITLVLQYRFLFRLSYKNDGFRQIHAGGNGRSFLISVRGIHFMYFKLYPHPLITKIMQ